MADRWPRDLWLEAIWECEEVKPLERIVAHVFARYAGAGETSWASWNEIKRRTGIRSKDAVWRAVTGLEFGGWLTEVQRARQHQSPIYRLTCPLSSSESVPLEPDEVLPARGSSSLPLDAFKAFSGVRLTDRSGVRLTDPWSADGTSGVRQTAPEVRENDPEVRENVARGPLNGKPVLRRDLQVENSEERSEGARSARDPSDARFAPREIDPNKPHTFIEASGGKCHCGLDRGEHRKARR